MAGYFNIYLLFIPNILLVIFLTFNEPFFLSGMLMGSSSFTVMMMRLIVALSHLR
jgi:hypothetical protein